MQYMGEMFKLLRTSRHISLKEATGDAFSHSMLSRFENGESDITISKLLVGLSNIRTELNEFVYLANGFKPSPYAVLKQEIWEAISKKTCPAYINCIQKSWSSIIYTKRISIF